MKKIGNPMKKITNLISALCIAPCAVAVIFAASSCNKETQKEIGEHYVVLGTTISEESETRVNFIKDSDDNNKAIFGWQLSDQVGVSINGEEGFAKLGIVNPEYTGNGMYKTLFGGTVSGEVGDYVVYPYNEGHRLSGKELTFCLPSEYTYTHVDSDYYGGSNSANPPALGKISKISSDNLTVTLSHLGGVLCIKVDKMPAASGSVSVTSDRQICGNFKITLDGNEKDYALLSSSDSDKTVTIKYSGAIEGESGVFFFPMPFCFTDSKMKVSVSIIGEKTKSGSTLTTSYTVSDKSISFGLGEIKPVKVTTKYSYSVDGKNFIDLGLESGLLWAEKNIGALYPESFGDYFAWGETAEKESYSWSNYKYGTAYNKIEKYYPGVDDKNVLEAEDDAASVNWGAWCRIPSTAEFEELLSSCTWTREDKYYLGETRCGMTVKGPNGNSIYFSGESGYKNGTDTYDRDSEGDYWANSCPTSGNTSCAYYLYIRKNTLGAAHGVAGNPQRNRSDGIQVRAVVSLSE